MKICTITEFCVLHMGQSPSSETYNESGEGLPFYQGNADFGEIHPKTRVWCSKPTKTANKGDILISVRAPIGAMNIADEKCCIGRGLAALSPKTNTCNPQYLFYAMQSRVDGLIAQGTGSTFKAISKKILESTQIPAFSLKKQEYIVKKLSAIDTLIAWRKSQINHLEKIVSSRFIEMFHGFSTRITLSDVAEVTGGITKNSKREKLPLKMPYLRVANVFFATIDISEMLEIGLTNDEAEKTKLKYGDLLFVEGNGSPDQIGRVAIWHDEIVPCVHQNHLIKARINQEKVVPIFAMYYFMSQEGRDQIKSKAVSTSGLYTLSVSKVATFTLPVPPLALQAQFAAFVRQSDKSKFIISQSLNHLAKLSQKTEKYQ